VNNELAIGHGANGAEAKKTLVGGYQSEIVDLSGCGKEAVRRIIVKEELLRGENNFVGKGRVPLYAGKRLGEPVGRACRQEEPFLTMQC
jgi:hypothetical protein